MERDFLPQKSTGNFSGLDPPHIARLKQQLNHNPLLMPQSISQIAGRQPLPLLETNFTEQNEITDVSRLRS